MKNHGMSSARDIWASEPLLSRAFADYQSFEESLRFARGDTTAMALDAKRQWFASEREALADARQRADACRRPVSAPSTGWRAATRQGARLTLWLYGPVTFSGPELCQALEENADAAGIVLRIDSPGGHLETGWRLAGMLANHRGRTVAIVDRSCWSAAMLAAVSCDRVLVRRSATMMIHPTWRATAGSSSQLMEAARAAQSDDQRYLRYLSAKRRSVGPKPLAAAFDQERFMTSDEAVRLGFADGITHDLPDVCLAAQVPASDVSLHAP